MRDGIPFTKMTGSGNDFVLVDNRADILAGGDVASFARTVCRRGLGLGADGVLLIRNASRDDAHFRWDYVNADGSTGAMCGNGAMCGARFAVATGIAPATCRFETDAGLVDARVDPGSPRVEIRLDIPATLPQAEIDIDGRVWRFDRLTVGVPHAVAWAEDPDTAFDAAGFDRWGRTVRYHAQFNPEGTNANLTGVLDRQTIRMRTWERGVEAETLACGTGAVASALSGIARSYVQPPVRVVVSSGESLTVSPGEEGIWLGGSARFVARGTIDPEVWAPDRRAIS